jgi:hypothetical protein
MPSKIWNVVLLLLTAIFSSTACSSSQIYVTHSRWADYQIVIDGKADKWQGTQAFLEKEKLFVSFLNDREYLYFGLVASGREAGAQLMRQGLMVWLDPKGGKNKSFGIRYPLAAEFPGPAKNSGENRPGDKSDRENREPMDMEGRPPQEPGQELEIVRAQKGEPEKMVIGQAKEMGLEINVSTSGELFVYELKIPLEATQTHPLAIGVQPGAEFSIGIESTGKGKSRPPGGHPPGGIEGGGTGPGGGTPGAGGMPGVGGPPSGGLPGGAGRGMEDFNTQPDIGRSLQCWLVVRLANK